MTFSISDLEQLSGISTHTIRIWERRYNALKPDRSAGNTRFYNDNQLRRLLNIVSLVNSGVKISKACTIEESEMDTYLQNEMDKDISNKLHFDNYVNKLIKYGFDYNENLINTLLSDCIGNYGVTETYKSVIYPLLIRLGIMWRTDVYCPSQEHFLTSIIRQKLFRAIDSLPVNPNAKQSWLLFLPEDEDHDIGLLFANYLLRLYGYHVIYLGPKVPISSVAHAAQKNSISNALVFFIKSRSLTETKVYLGELSTIFKTSKINLAGNVKFIENLELGQNINWLKTLNEFEQIINSAKDAK